MELLIVLLFILVFLALGWFPGSGGSMSSVSFIAIDLLDALLGAPIRFMLDCMAWAVNKLYKHTNWGVLRSARAGLITLKIICTPLPRTAMDWVF